MATLYVSPWHVEGCWPCGLNREVLTCENVMLAQDLHTPGKNHGGSTYRKHCRQIDETTLRQPNHTQPIQMVVNPPLLRSYACLRLLKLPTRQALVPLFHPRTERGRRSPIGWKVEVRELDSARHSYTTSFKHPDACCRGSTW